MSKFQRPVDVWRMLFRALCPPEHTIDGEIDHVYDTLHALHLQRGIADKALALMDVFKREGRLRLCDTAYGWIPPLDCQFGKLDVTAGTLTVEDSYGIRSYRHVFVDPNSTAQLLKVALAQKQAADAVAVNVGKQPERKSRTNVDKKKAVQSLLVSEKWRDLSDRRIAREAAVSPTYVGKQRKLLASGVHMDSSDVHVDNPHTAHVVDTELVRDETRAVSPAKRQKRKDRKRPAPARSADPSIVRDAPAASSGSKRGPAPGSLKRFAAADKKLFPKMKRLIKTHKTSPTGAAKLLAEYGEVEGVGSADSRARRLARAFIQERKRL